MEEIEFPIPIYELAFLQAFLFEFFSLEGQCHKNIDRTIWHLKQKYSDEEVETVISFFRKMGIKCDCDIIRNFDVRDISNKKIEFHEGNLK